MDLIVRSDDERLKEWGISVYDFGDIGMQRALSDLALAKASLRAALAARDELQAQLCRAMTSLQTLGRAAVLPAELPPCQHGEEVKRLREAVQWACKVIKETGSESNPGMMPSWFIDEFRQRAGEG